MVVAGTVALETVLVEGKLFPGKAEENGNRVLGIGCDVALDDGDGGEDGEGVLLVAEAVLPVVGTWVVFAVVVVIVEVVEVLASYNGFVVVWCRTGVVSVVEAVATPLSAVTCAVVRFTFSTGFTVVAFNLAALVPVAVPAGGAELLEGMKAAGWLDVVGGVGAWSVDTACLVNERTVDEFFSSSDAFAGVSVMPVEKVDKFLAGGNVDASDEMALKDLPAVALELTLTSLPRDGIKFTKFQLVTVKGIQMQTKHAYKQENKWEKRGRISTKHCWYNLCCLITFFTKWLSESAKFCVNTR